MDSNTTTDTISAVCSALAPKTVESEIDAIPAPLTSLYQERYRHMNDHQLKKEAKRVFYSMKILDREAIAIKRAAIAQHSSVQWRDQYSGRITVSLFQQFHFFMMCM